MLTVLLLPGALRAFIPALLGRSALAMAGLGLILSVQAGTGSFTAAGTSSAVFGLANVVAAPWRARAVDRWGQCLVLSLLGLLQALGFAGLAIAAALDAPFVAFVSLSVAVGATAPPLGAAMRVIWGRITNVGDERKKAFSLDAVAEELLFVGGPVAIAALVATTSAAAGLFVTGVVVLIGTLGLTSSAASRAQAGSPLPTPSRKRPLRQAGFVRVLVVLTAVGCVLGVAEIVAPAIAEENGEVAASGWLLAAFATGSALGGVAYGHVRWRASLGTKMLLLSAGMGAVALAISQTHAILPFTIGLAILGAFLAPSLITGYLVADAIVPEQSRTEASTWVNTAVNLGAAMASAVAGVLIDQATALLPLTMVGLLALLGSTIVPWSRLRHVGG